MPGGSTGVTLAIRPLVVARTSSLVNRLRVPLFARSERRIAAAGVAEPDRSDGLPGARSFLA